MSGGDGHGHEIFGTREGVRISARYVIPNFAGKNQASHATPDPDFQNPEMGRKPTTLDGRALPSKVGNPDSFSSSKTL
jgi:hypothetical protein